MLPFPKKRKTTSIRVSALAVHTQKNLVEWGEKADASNLERGLLSLPVELSTEILDYFPVIGPYNAVDDSRLLPDIYALRIDMLRALSQVCIDYRRVFLPLLWESLNICFMRQDNPGSTRTFYKHVGEALLRKCDSLLANPNLASYIGTVRVILTRYESAVIPKKLALFLSSLPNLHTLQVFHAHTQMTTAIKNGFQGVVLPKIRTLIIPEHCHEILKCCPKVTKVWCNRGDGSKLVTVIGKHCKEVQEMRGFYRGDGKLVKRIIKAAPNLRVLEINIRNFEPLLIALSSFKDINTIIINARPYSEIHLNRCIETTKQRLNDLAPSKERRYIRVWHGNNDLYFQTGDSLRSWRNRDINAYVRDYYSEVPVSIYYN